MYSLKYECIIRQRFFPDGCVKADKMCSGYISTLPLTLSASPCQRKKLPELVGAGFGE